MHDWEWVEKRTKPIAMMVSEPGDHANKKFRLKYTFVVKRNSNLFQALGVKLRHSDKIFAISGFPSTLEDLQRRSTLQMAAVNGLEGVAGAKHSKQREASRAI